MIREYSVKKGIFLWHFQVPIVATLTCPIISICLADKSETICGKAEGVSWWMEPLGRFPRVLNGLPREYIEGPPRGFLTANPRAHPRPDPRPKTLLVFGQGSGWGCGRGFARRKSRGEAFNILPRESIGYSRDLPRGSIHHNIPMAFPQIVILFGSQTKKVKRTTFKILPMLP